MRCLAPALGNIPGPARYLEIVQVSIGRLRGMIAEALAAGGGSDPNEAYDKELVDDPSFKAPSVYVPDDIKGPLSRWMRAMGLAGSKKKRPRSA